MKNYRVQCFVICSIFILCVRAAFAFEEEHAAHEHGHATLMVVQEKDELQLLFKSPAMNIVGFEHRPSSVAQHAKIDSAKTSLTEGEKLFQLSQSAQCELEHVHISSSLLGEDEKSEEHSDHHSDHHDDHHDDAHGDGEDESSHSEFEAQYHFECQRIDALKEIQVRLFDVFDSLEEVEAHIIVSTGQKLVELDHNKVSIKF